ncbi:VCBS repeat-containing protein [Arenibacter sp. M-2]|uniref:VCBS repeat-containing protein n=1 Tax=Arenibacter sp. M-2 TaxID=3053612 RepID=UPI002570B127|nr:VCBS repeat-containing protein [Arenibacter sp. M-2]MDL5512275.1 VCBS repeat-containing protein [Arenibacter sp. M-2]
MNLYLNNSKFYILLSVVFVLQSCKNVGESKSGDLHIGETTLFTVMYSMETGINFINEIPESSAMNSMVYEYFYNGGGVAIGDIDNDGLPDIYFTSNLKENKLYKNNGHFQFEDITKTAKVEGSFGWTTGVTMADVNADGWLDIYVCKSGKGKAENRENLLFINNKNGSFKEEAQEYGLNFSGYSTQAAFFDFDKDGDLDMFLLNHNVTPINTDNPEKFKKEDNPLSGDRLYRNDNGKFTDISSEAGILNNSMGFGLGVSLGDLNQDGWPDIYVANDYIEQDYLYYNNGDGTFSENLKKSMGHTSNFSMGTDIADFNNDGLLDIMSLDMVAEDNYGIKTSMSGMNPKAFHHAVNNGFHYQYMYNALQMNNGNETFGDLAQLAGVSNTDWSWGPLFADFDNDGLKDLFISNGLKRDFRNNDFRKYKLKRLEEAQKNGENMAKVIEELVKKTPQRKTHNYFFKNKGDLTFEKVMKDWGVDIPTFSNGAAYADLDLDGDLDLVINNIDEEATVLRNNASVNYVQFRFKGNDKNPFGIGAKIWLETEKGIQLAENYPTRGYQSAVEPILHFGLGQDAIVKNAIVTWPDGKSETFTNLHLNQKIVVEYKNAVTYDPNTKNSAEPIFKDITEEMGHKHVHIENEYDDFSREILLPHKMSQFGPGLTVGDVNNDGLEDFFIGGAKGYEGVLYLQEGNGSFSPWKGSTWNRDKEFEDVDAEFFDADNDGDLDLYVVSGGNEWEADNGMYQDRLYINDGGDFSKSNDRLPTMTISGSTVKPYDFDEDGDMDLFVGSRMFPHKYPYFQTSKLLENVNGFFKDVTIKKAPALQYAGMITDAIWTDYDGDNKTDLIVVGEWTGIGFYKNKNGRLEPSPDVLPQSQGWWNCVEAFDMDSDGDMDFVVGNLGLNSKYKASHDAPFEVYSTDFDDNGTNDIVLGYYDKGNLFPLRGRECSSQQMPFIKEKFPTYDSFGSAKLDQVYDEEKLKEALHLKVSSFASIYLENLGNARFKIHNLPNEAQVSAINDIVIQDFDGDGINDIVVAGNLYQTEVETPRNDASIGILLKGYSKSLFSAIPYSQSGLFTDGDVKKIRAIRSGSSNNTCFLVAKNDDSLRLIKVN